MAEQCKETFFNASKTLQHKYEDIFKNGDGIDVQQKTRRYRAISQKTLDETDAGDKWTITQSHTFDWLYTKDCKKSCANEAALQVVDDSSVKYSVESFSQKKI